VPEQISLMGFDDVEVARLVHPRLSTIAYPLDELARCAARIALNLADGLPAGASQPCFAPTLVIRESVRQFA
jgi:LacI family transcriptional regulator